MNSETNVKAPFVRIADLDGHKAYRIKIMQKKVT